MNHAINSAASAYVRSRGIQPIGFCSIGSPTRPDRDRIPEDTEDIEDPVLIRIVEEHGVHPAVICVKWAVQKGQIPIPFSAPMSCQGGVF
jgi:alcohol dehydrogenase (NADP+)